MIKNFFHNWHTERLARQAARAKIDVEKDLALARLGARTSLDPVHNPVHARLVYQNANRAELDELKHDHDALATAAARGKSVAGTLGKIGFIASFEIIGAAQFVKTLGIDSAHRLAIGAGLTIALVGATAMASNPPEGAPKSISETAKRTLRSAAVALAYTALVVSIAILRALANLDEEASLIEAVSGGVVLLAVAVGPAWALEILMREFKAAWRTRSELRLLARRLKAAERDARQARTELDQITIAGTRWDEAKAQSEATYRIANRLEQAAIAAREKAKEEKQNKAKQKRNPEPKPKRKHDANPDEEITHD